MSDSFRRKLGRWLRPNKYCLSETNRVDFEYFNYSIYKPRLLSLTDVYDLKPLVCNATFFSADKPISRVAQENNVFDGLDRYPS